MTGTASSTGQSSSSSEADATVKSFVASQDASTERYRKASTWIVTAFAAIAALLLAGTQLSSIGKLEAFSWAEDHRLVTAVISFAIGIGCTGIIIWQAVAVLGAGRVSLTTLSATERKGNDSDDLKWVRSSALFDGYGTESTRVTAFLEEDDRVRRLYDDALNADPQDADAIAAIEDQLAKMGYEVGQVVAGLRADIVRRRFSLAAKIMLAAGTVAAASILTFAWAANPEDEKPDPGLFEVPVLADVDFADSAISKFDDDLGTDCIAGPVRVIVLSATEADSVRTYDVVSVPTDRCELARLSIELPADGSVTAVNPVSIGP